MTRLLKETYEKKPLHVIPTAVLTPKSHLPLLKDLRSRPDHQGRNYNITFPSFATLASKAGTLMCAPAKSENAIFRSEASTYDAVFRNGFRTAPELK